VQNAHRRAGAGMSLRHSGHSRVGMSTGFSGFRRAMSAFSGRTTKKKIAAAIIRNAMTWFRKCP